MNYLTLEKYSKMKIKMKKNKTTNYDSPIFKKKKKKKKNLRKEKKNAWAVISLFLNCFLAFFALLLPIPKFFFTSALTMPKSFFVPVISILDYSSISTLFKQCLFTFFLFTPPMPKSSFAFTSFILVLSIIFIYALFVSKFFFIFVLLILG